MRVNVPIAEALPVSTQPAYIHQKFNYLLSDWKSDKLENLDAVIQSMPLLIGLMVIPENENS